MSEGRSDVQVPALDGIEALITRLVQEAPTLASDAISALCAQLRDDGRPLAIAIARVVELVGRGEIPAGISLPALAMACATLADARLGEREREAARYEIETLLPVPGKAPVIAAPDVPLGQLLRRRT